MSTPFRSSLLVVLSLLAFSLATLAQAQSPGQHPPPPAGHPPPPRPGMPPPPPRPAAPAPMATPAPDTPTVSEPAAASPTAAFESRLEHARRSGNAADIGSALMALATEHSRRSRDDLALPLLEEAGALANRSADDRLGREAALAATDIYHRRGDRALEQTWREQADRYRDSIASGVAAPPAPVAVVPVSAPPAPTPATPEVAAVESPAPAPPRRWPWLLLPLAAGLFWAWRRSAGRAERLHDETERLARHQRQLRSAHNALQEQAAQLRQAAVQDTLTGALSRTAFARELEDTLLHAAHYGKPVALMVFDLDHFKQINDSHGHLAGDSALKFVAGIVRENLRSEDLFGRFGGDEFLIGCADLDRDQALMLAEKIRSAAQLRAGAEDPRLAALSLSLGIAHADPGAGYALELLFSRADAALYAAKRGGRNRSVLEDPGTPAPPRDQHAPRSLASAS